jgi:nickel superoxide dismutase
MMTRFLLAAAVFCLLPFSTARVADAHCEVPCGIFADQMRFEKMLEDATTMKKAMVQLGQLAGKTDAQSINQAVRWVNTKEEHAKETQHVIAQYFMAQRIKPTQADYVKRLTTAHAVMTAAMKCKQTTDPANADALKAAIMAFHKAYAGETKAAAHGDHSHDHK